MSRLTLNKIIKQAPKKANFIQYSKISSFHTKSATVSTTMQVPSQNKLEIVSPNCAKSISFNFNNKESKPPLQLISWHEKKGFVVNPEAHKFFDTLRDNNLGIVTIVGKNRTGKSYLLNRVVLNQNSGFSVGHTVNPCTKGIWVWPHVIEIENKNNESEKLNVIVLDTEGTDATDQHENYDTKVFMLGMLLSSYFIYNSVGAIDEKAIQNLSLIINLSKHLQKTNEKEFEDLMECFPSFLWVVRDFALKLIDTQGNPITSKEYLENALKPQKGISEAIEAKNRIRRLLSNFFKDRDCFMMVRPTESENDMQSLHQLKPESLRPEFNEQVNTLRRKIWIKVKPKLFRGKPINGPGFLVLCKLLCNMLNSEETLSLENSWNSICRIECEKIVRDISEEYDQQMKAELEKAVINEHTMGNLHKKKKSEALENFKKRAMGDKVKNFEEVLNETLKQRFKSLKNMFYSKIESRMKETVEERLEGFEKKIQNREFATFTDLVIEFKSIKVELEQEYKSPESHEALLEYLFQSFFRASETFYDDIETSRKQNERLRQADLEGFESKLAYIEKHHQEKMQESTDNFRQLETEKMKLRSHIASLEDKIKEIENERSNESVLIDQKVQEIIKEHQAKEANLKTQLKELSTQLQQLKHEKEELVEDKEALMAEAESKLVQKLEEAKKEKQELAMKNEEIIRDQEHEVEYKEEQIESLNYTISGLKKELEQERHSHKASIHAMEEIKKMMTVSPMKTSRRKDQMEDGCRCRLMDEVLKENKDLKRNIDILNARMESNVDEFYLQRNDLENKLKEIERHYREKQLQDEFALSTLKKRIKTYENADMAMAETNKNLSLTLERADTRCFNLEKKVVKLKKYHKIFKHADEISCKFCGKMVKKTLFMAHFEICNLNDDRNYDECSLYQHPSLNITLDKHGHHTLANRAFKIEGQLGRQRCSVTKSFQDVHHLIYAIKDQVKHSEILPYLEELLKVNEERLSEENWAKTKELLNDVLSSLAKMPQVRDSQAFRDFLPMREPSENLTSTYSHSPEESSFPSSRGRENRIIFDATEQHPKKSSHSRKASHRYYDEKESYINHVLGDKGKRAITINPDIGPKEPAFYESFDT